MLIEAWLAASARTTSDLRRLGLVGDAVALWSRATRRRRVWAAHEARCHVVVDGAAAALTRRRHAVVLGSGLARDVPLAGLSAAFERVTLVDAVHLWPVRRRAGRLGNVHLAVVDLTGCAGWLVGEAAGPADPFTALRADPTLDLVISANCLSQLPFAVESWAATHPERVPDAIRDLRHFEDAGRVPSRNARNGCGCSEARPAIASRQDEDGGQRFGDLAAALVRRHLDGLASLPARVCLLTDVAMRERDLTGATRDTRDLLRGIALPPPDERWDWTVAPPGEIRRGRAFVHRVHAYRDWAKAVSPRAETL